MRQPAKAVDFIAGKNIVIISIITISYLLLSTLLVGFKEEQLILAAIFNILYYAAPGTRKFITGFSIFIIYWIVFDYMKAFPNYDFNTVHIEGLYNTEKYLFGISSSGHVITPNEFLLQHTSVLQDIVTGFFYLCWVPVPLLFATYLFYKNRSLFLQFALTFFLVNIIGFIIYYIYPAAPPWYVQQHGAVFIANTPGYAAGLLRFDSFFHIDIFRSLYTKSSNVFAAMPSLHSSYPVIVLYYGIKGKMGKTNILFAIIMLGIWYAALYNSHHYVLDVLAGIACALTGIWLFQKLLSSAKSFRSFFSAMLLKIK